MKIWKKNLIAAAILVTVCAGIYVNWLYAGDSKSPKPGQYPGQQEGHERRYAGAQRGYGPPSWRARRMRPPATAILLRCACPASGQRRGHQPFAGGSQRLRRQQGGGTAADLEDIVQTALSEAQIESLIIAKGYADCVAYMTNDGISVAVSAPGGRIAAAGCGGDCGRGHVPVRLRPGQHPGGGGPLNPGKTARCPCFQLGKAGARAL